MREKAERPKVKRMSARQVGLAIELRKKFHLLPDEWWDEGKGEYVIPSSVRLYVP